MSFEIDIDNRQHALAIDELRLQKAILVTLHQELVESAVLSISLVDDPTIHQLNRKHLQHDYPTDVISFQLEQLVVSEQPNETGDGK
ncbi:MAG: rRNA maturation RNase YbeY, partial [Planctomycetaceae bacterium]